MNSGETVLWTGMVLVGILGTSICGYKWWKTSESLDELKREKQSAFQGMQYDNNYIDIGKRVFRIIKCGHVGFRDCVKVDDKVPGLYAKEFECYEFREHSFSNIEISEVEKALQSGNFVFKDGLTRDDIEKKITEAKQKNEDKIEGIYIWKDYRYAFSNEKPENYAELCDVDDAERYMDREEESKNVLFSEVSKDEVLKRVEDVKKKIVDKKLIAETFKAVTTAFYRVSTYMDVAQKSNCKSADMLFEMLGKAFVELSNTPEFGEGLRGDVPYLKEYIKNVNNAGEYATAECREDAKWLSGLLDKFGISLDEGTDNCVNDDHSWQ